MFFAVLIFFKEPRRSEVETAKYRQRSVARPRKQFPSPSICRSGASCIFLLIFSGYWIVFWQQYIILPIYIHDYINPSATELMLVTGPLTVISCKCWSAY